MHPLGKRPISFFGPDCKDPTNWQRERARIVDSQLNWDGIYMRLPFMSRLLCSIFGDVTEPVHTSEGMPIDIILNECLKYSMEKRNEAN
jgi:hypothetical protein